MKASVPDSAIVPKWLFASSRVIPIPLSVMVKVLASLSALIWILKLGSSLIKSGLVKDMKCNLSIASEAFEINSRRKTSLFEYKELASKSSNLVT